MSSTGTTKNKVPTSVNKTGTKTSTNAGTGPVSKTGTTKGAIKSNTPVKPVVKPGVVKVEHYQSGSTTLVETLLLLLIVVNGFTSGQFKGLWGILSGKSKDVNKEIRQGFVVLGGELVFLVFLSLVAKSGPEANRIVTTMIVVMWLGWFFHNRKHLEKWSTKVIPKK